MIGSICDYFTGKIFTAFCGLTIPLIEIGKGFQNGKAGSDPLGFLANP